MESRYIFVMNVMNVMSVAVKCIHSLSYNYHSLCSNMFSC